jgi:hypothetical protein
MTKRDIKVSIRQNSTSVFNTKKFGVSSMNLPLRFRIQNSVYQTTRNSAELYGIPWNYKGKILRIPRNSAEVKSLIPRNSEKSLP